MDDTPMDLKSYYLAVTLNRFLVVEAYTATQAIEEAERIDLNDWEKFPGRFDVKTEQRLNRLLQFTRNRGEESGHIPQVGDLDSSPVNRNPSNLVQCSVVGDPRTAQGADHVSHDASLRS